MADLSIIAKPYAKAAYEFAKESKTVEQWSDALKTLKTIVLNEDVLNLIFSPVCSQLQIAIAIEESLKKQFDEKIINFLMIMAQSNRLAVLSRVSDIFEELKDHENGNQKAEVTLAFEADEDMILQLKEKLAKRFGCTIDLEINIDPSIIGGAIVRMGDTVIDSSVSGRLDKMKNILLS